MRMSQNVAKWLPRCTLRRMQAEKCSFCEVDVLKTKISWNCALENGAYLCVTEDQKLNECRVSLTERKKERKKDEEE